VSKHIVHWDDVESGYDEAGTIGSTWTPLSRGAKSRDVRLNRIRVEAGRRSTPLHSESDEEIFYVLAGEGISWQRGRTAPVCAGDCIVYHPRRGEHGLRAGDDGLDLLAFGPREYDEALRLPRLDASLINGRAVASEPGTADGHPFQFVREAAPRPPARFRTTWAALRAAVVASAGAGTALAEGFPGHSYQFRARAHSTAGLVSSWSTGTTQVSASATFSLTPKVPSGESASKRENHSCA